MVSPMASPKVDYPIASCVECGRPFKPKTMRSTYCSSSCKHKLDRVLYPEKGTCIEADCSRPVRAKDRCSSHYNAWRYATGQAERWYKWTDAGRDAYHRRRAAKKNPEGRIERFKISEIAERDDYTCQICDGPVNMRLPYPNPASPSQDHKIPLSRGGEHVFDNVQLAHLVCNSGKSAKMNYILGLSSPSVPGTPDLMSMS